MRNLIIQDDKTRILVFILFLLVFTNSNTLAQDNSSTHSVIDSLQEKNDNWEQFSIQFGGFLTNYNSGISLGSESLGIGVHIDLEEALGLQTSTFGFRGNANYRFGKKMKHTVSFGYFGVYRNAYKVLESELEIGNTLIPVGTEIKSQFDLTILHAKYDYSFLQNQNVSLGASFGLFIMPLSFSVETVNFEEQATDFVAPLPVLGLRSNFSITKKLFLAQSIELLLLKISNFQGRITDLDIHIEHKTYEHISFGLGLNSNLLNIKAKGKDYPNINFFGQVRMEYTGVYLFAKYRF